jgi:Protein of unknown function (DUF3108)
MILCLKYFLIIPIAAINLFQSLKTQKIESKISFESNKKIEVGEELDYVVKYAFFVLGQITIKVTGKFNYKGQTYYRAEANIDSYNGIPFVDIHQIYKTIFPLDVYSSSFTGIVKNDDYSTFTQYNFRYDSSKVEIQKGKIFPHQLWTDSTAEIDKKYQDGLSIFYYARVNSGQEKSEDVPCFINEKKEITKINFYKKVYDISIDAIDYPVACVKVDGEMNFVSIYGLTGGFEGWFTDDEDAVPIYAKMHVIVGNVTIELKEWKKNGWVPPKYESN